MLSHLPALFTAPADAWERIREDAERHPWGFLPLMLLGSLIPAIASYIGAAHVGWQFYGNDEVQFLRPASAMLLATMCYLGFISALIIMSLMTRWVLFRTPQRPSMPISLTFVTVTALPLMLAGLTALVPYRPVLLIGGGLAAGLSCILLFFGLPSYMCMPRNDHTRFFAACIVGTGLLTLAVVGFVFLEMWWQPLEGGLYENVAAPE
ncbi:Yip1 family protein [Halopseudomonas pelagia]|uniref:Yip1 family protein n=1 Tax=Halopseudomonas pelagia TaxID=553151 RepID=UPI0003A64832|nr:Yip1 family protein [Halopseudomonas pelagia]